MNGTHIQRLSRPAALTVFGLGTAALGPAAEAQIEFHPPREYPGDFQEVAVADLNGDGHLDAALGTPDGVHVFFNTGDGTLVNEVTLFEGIDVITVRSGDVDRDGHVDLVILERGARGIRRLHFFYNDGDGRRGEVHSRNMPDYMWRGITLADVTRNGQLDVVYIASLTILLLEHRGRGEYGGRPLYQWTYGHADVVTVSPPAVGDLDGDGDLDAAARYTYTHGGGVGTAEIVVLFKLGTQPPRAHVINLLGWLGHNYAPSDIMLGDMDGDGDMDIVVVASDYYGAYKQRNYGLPQVGILINDGRGNFERGPVFDVGLGSGDSLALSDLDSDGRLDIIVTTQSNESRLSTLHVLRNLGDLRFDAPFDVPINDDRGVSGRGVGDFDGDGQPDIVVTTWLGRMYQFLNATPIDNPLLSVGPLGRGQAAEFLVIGAEPDETVHFLYSLTGQGNSRGVGLLGGITLDLLTPIVNFGAATADAQGEAALVRIVPTNAPLRPVTFQSIIRRGPEGRDSVKSPFQVGVIEE